MRLTFAASDSLNLIFVPLGTFFFLALTAVDFELTANLAGETFSPLIAGAVVSGRAGPGGPGRWRRRRAAVAVDRAHVAVARSPSRRAADEVVGLRVERDAVPVGADRPERGEAVGLAPSAPSARDASVVVPRGDVPHEHRLVPAPAPGDQVARRVVNAIRLPSAEIDGSSETAVPGRAARARG